MVPLIDPEILPGVTEVPNAKYGLEITVLFDDLLQELAPTNNKSAIQLNCTRFKSLLKIVFMFLVLLIA